MSVEFCIRECERKRQNKGLKSRQLQSMEARPTNESCKLHVVSHFIFEDSVERQRNLDPVPSKVEEKRVNELLDSAVYQTKQTVPFPIFHLSIAAVLLRCTSLFGCPTSFTKSHSLEMEKSALKLTSPICKVVEMDDQSSPMLKGCAARASSPKADSFVSKL